MTSNKGDDVRNRGIQNWLEALTASRRVERLIYRRISSMDPDSVKDLAQDVYERLLRYARDGVRNPGAYVLEVTANVAHDFARKQSRERKVVVFDDVTVSTRAESIEDESANHAQVVADQRDLRSLIEKLPPLLRAAVILRKRDELSYKQIGKAIGKSHHTAKKYVAKAIAHCAVRIKRR